MHEHDESDQPEIQPRAPRRAARPWVLAAGAVVIAGAGIAVGVGLSGCSSTPASAPAAAASASSAAAAPSSAAPVVASPGSSECVAFGQVYNSQVGPLLTRGANGNVDVYFTQLGDAFTALAASVADGADAYSQTIHADAVGVAAAPSSFTAIEVFNRDLPAFLQQCGMSAGTATPS